MTKVFAAQIPGQKAITLLYARMFFSWGDLSFDLTLQRNSLQEVPPMMILIPFYDFPHNNDYI
jgi:hypothetical protein